MSFGWSLSLALVVLLACLAYMSAALAAVVRFVRRPPPAVAKTPQPVTVLKPLCGADPDLYDNLLSFCRQQHPRFQVIFGVRERADPAVAVVRRLQRELPDADLVLVVDPRVHGANYKVSNLINMLPAAQHDLLVIADSDVRVDPSYLRWVPGAPGGRAGRARDGPVQGGARTGFVVAPACPLDQRLLPAGGDPRGGDPGRRRLLRCDHGPAPPDARGDRWLSYDRRSPGRRPRAGRAGAGAWVRGPGLAVPGRAPGRAAEPGGAVGAGAALGAHHPRRGPVRACRLRPDARPRPHAAGRCPRRLLQGRPRGRFDRDDGPAGARRDGARRGTRARPPRHRLAVAVDLARRSGGASVRGEPRRAHGALARPPVHPERQERSRARAGRPKDPSDHRLTGISADDDEIAVPASPFVRRLRRRRRIPLPGAAGNPLLPVLDSAGDDAAAVARGRRVLPVPARATGGSALKRRLIVTADDFGLDLAVNEAVEQAATRGILTAASLMVAGPAAADAVERARRLPGLAVGLHLVLVDGAPALPPERIPDLVGPDGRFSARMVRAGASFFFRSAVRRQLAAEIRTQFEAFAATGLPLDHADAHRHMHVHPTVARLMVEIGAGFGLRAVRVPSEPLALLPGERPGWAARLGDAGLGLWVRLLRRRLQRAGLQTSDRVFGLAWSGAMIENRVLPLIEALPAGICEIYFHPAARRTPALVAAMPDYRHVEELQALCSARVRDAIERAGMELTTFGALGPAPMPAAPPAP